MPYIHKWKETGVIREFSGAINAAQVLNSNLELHAHKRFNDIDYVLNDFTAATEIVIAAEQTTAFATTDEMVALTKGELKIAIVISNAFLPAALAYQKQMIDSSFTCLIFEAISEAEQWCLTSK